MLLSQLAVRIQFECFPSFKLFKVISNYFAILIILDNLQNLINQFESNQILFSNNKWFMYLIKTIETN